LPKEYVLRKKWIHTSHFKKDFAPSKYSKVCELHFWIMQYEDTPKGDEAHFWLNGYVKKQNCRIWSEANPQVYAETPLHPEKLTVWCALWACGILLQKR
ncbi:hypothetical protein TNCV_3616461, partial [Trichonephila clavipes]